MTPLLLTLLVPGVIHPICFFREFFFRFYAIMAKLLEITPINHIYLERKLPRHEYANEE
jgi:hypothetical protein